MQLDRFAARHHAHGFLGWPDAELGELTAGQRFIAEHLGNVLSECATPGGNYSYFVTPAGGDSCVTWCVTVPDYRGHSDGAHLYGDADWFELGVTDLEAIEGTAVPVVPVAERLSVLGRFVRQFNGAEYR